MRSVGFGLVVIHVVVENRGRLLEVREQLEDLHENLASRRWHQSTPWYPPFMESE